MPRLADVLDVALTVARVADEHEIRYPAAALAYYAFVSFVPVVVLAFGIIGEQFAGWIYTTSPRFLTPGAQRLVYDATTAASGRGGAALLAILALAWSGANIAVDFQTVVERIEETGEDPLVEQLRDAVVVLGSLGLAIVSIVLTSVAFALLPDGLLLSAAGAVVLFVALTAAFVPLYYVPSTVLESPTAALPGALTAASGWTVLHTGVQFYAGNASQYAVYGVLSGIIIILTSLYIAAIVLMGGIVVNATLSDGGVRVRS
jgi:membrane protein